MKTYMRTILALTVAALLAGVAARAEESEVEYYRQQGIIFNEEEQETPVDVPTDPLIQTAAPQPAQPVHTAQTVPPVQQYYAQPDALHQQHVRDYRLSRAMECVDDTQPSGAFVVIPQYFHSRNDNARIKVGSQRLRVAKSRANGSGVTALFNKRLTDWFSFSLMYEYGFMKVSGGGVYADNPAVFAGGRESSRWHSHVVGFLPEFDFQRFGKLQLSVIQGFDRASGSESVVYAGGAVDRRHIDDYGTNVTSLMAWYEKDFGLSEHWKLTPYAGWRSLYVVVKDQNDFSRAPGVRSDSNTWVHLASAGVKLSYQCGPLGISVRGGINHRNTHDDIPGYGNRAVAPGVVHFSHRANMDRTVGTVGAAISYAAHKRLVVSVGYDGYFGSDTSAHMASMAFAITF